MTIYFNNTFIIMKRNLSLLAIALIATLFACSCNKQQVDYDGPVDLTVTLSVPTHSAEISTKTSGDQSTNDVTIKTVQIFVFDQATGQIDNCAIQAFTPARTTTATLTQTISCTQGTKEIWAVVNWPEDLTASVANVTSVATLKAKTASLSDNAVDGLLMSGYKQNVNLSTPATAENITVNRLCAAVVVKAVNNQMLVPAYQGRVSIIGAYLMNVPGVQSVDGSIAASSSSSPLSSWMAMYTRPSSALLNEAFSAVNIAYNSAHDTPHTFYTFANDYNDVAGNGSDKSSTYLKVVLSIDGVTYYYPVILPLLERNKKYEVTLTVNHISGITDPNDWNPVSSTVLTPSVTVSGWTTVPVGETI